MAKSNEKDLVFAQVMQDMLGLIMETASKASQEVLELSSTYLNQKAQTAIVEFYNLYFSKKRSIVDSKDAVNKEVDSLFEQAQAALKQGGEINLKTTKEADDIRLGISAIQKELEALIRVEEGMKEKLAPVLACMQFEDALRQRLDHIQEGWQEVFGKHCDEKAIDVELIKSKLTSIAETEIFYRNALKQEPPPTQGERESSVLFF